MKLTSLSIQDNELINPIYAMGMVGPEGFEHPIASQNINPHLSWSDFPSHTQSFVVICHDPDAPTELDRVNQIGQIIPFDLPRTHFYHWVLANIPAHITHIDQGADSQGITPKGKPTGQTLIGTRGINDYTAWFANDPEMAGNYGGYDGPWPPFNDERVHRYIFTVYALDVPTLILPENFAAPMVIERMKGHILDEALIMGFYAIYPQAR